MGGKYFADIKSEKDGKDNWSTGTYKEIVHHKKIVYGDSFADSKGNKVSGSEYGMGQMPMETTVTFEFEEQDDKTIMTLHHTGTPVSMADDCTQGWQSSFDKMANNLNNKL